MSYPHRIRLRGPWEYSVIQSSALDVAYPTGRVHLPSDWSETLGPGFRGRVAYRRHFNSPTQLDAHERVWLVIEGVDPRGTVTLNGRPLGEVKGYGLFAEFDITAELKPRNDLALEVELSEVTPDGIPPLRPGREEMAGGPIGEVYLDIRSSAFLDRCSLEAQAHGGRPRIVLRGTVVGDPQAGTLELIAHDEGGELLFAEVSAGESIEIAAEAPNLATWQPSGAGRNVLTTIHVRLLSSGARLWETELKTAWREIHWNETCGDLTVARQRIPFPFPTNDMVHNSATYEQWDASGELVVQAMPLDWAGDVCPRLAHHPSIVAWTTPAGEPGAASAQIQEVNSFGRPWIPRKTVLGG